MQALCTENAKLNRVEGVDLFFYLFLQADSQAEKSVCQEDHNQKISKWIGGRMCLSLINTRTLGSKQVTRAHIETPHTK